jgi:hypothetical protein
MKKNVKNLPEFAKIYANLKQFYANLQGFCIVGYNIDSCLSAPDTGQKSTAPS